MCPGTIPKRGDKVKYFLGEQSNGAAKLQDAYPRGIGRCFVTRPIDPFVNEPWFLDNGVFPAWNRPDENGDTRTPDRDYSDVYANFESRFGRVAELVAEGRGPDFMVIPDRPGEASSLMVSTDWLLYYIEYVKNTFDPDGTVPLYLAVQDGFDAEDVEHLLASSVGHAIGGLFLGGTDEFKATTIRTWRALATRFGIKLHYGRCTQTRLQEALDAGCDSADSSHPLRRGPNRWARFLEVFDAVVGHPPLAPWITQEAA